jgi:hypothetical protein
MIKMLRSWKKCYGHDNLLSGAANIMAFKLVLKMPFAKE